MANDFVHVFEVGPRDGLQNEPRRVSLEHKIWFLNELILSGIKDIEFGSFVRPDKVPQMKDTDKIYKAIEGGKLHLGKARDWVLVPNRKGLERAVRAGAHRIALFTAATSSFSERNMGMSISESLKEFKAVIHDAQRLIGPQVKVRGYVSTAFGCPFEGKVTTRQALKVIEKLAELGVDQISVGDTIGVATPYDVKALILPVMKLLGVQKTAVHFHDTRGTALANTLQSLELGVRVVDSSTGGLGGCPFAPGASGNLATEDLVYMLNGMGIKTGVDLHRLCSVSLEMAKRMKRNLTSRYLQSFAAQCGSN